MDSGNWFRWLGIFAVTAFGCSSGDGGRNELTGLSGSASNPTTQSGTSDLEPSSGEAPGSSSGGATGTVTDSGEATSSSGGSTGSDSSSGGDTTGNSGDTTGSSDGDTTGSTGEDTTGAAQVCGDGVVVAPEQCDDGNEDNTDECLDTCLNASCGDGFVQAGVEDCDGNEVSNGSCEDCKLVCSALFGDCNMSAADGCEQPLAADLNNCGACGMACGANMKCEAGACIKLAVEHGPEHTFAGLMSNHFITQGCCSVNCAQNDAADADYFCKRFYGDSCTVKPGYFKGMTPFPTYPKMHKRDGCTSQGSDIVNTICDGGPCKIGNWSENTTGLTNLVCVCN